MTEQLFVDAMVSSFDANGADGPARKGLARFLPDSTFLVTLVSVISFAIMATGCVGGVAVGVPPPGSAGSFAAGAVTVLPSTDDAPAPGLHNRPARAGAGVGTAVTTAVPSR